MVLAGSPTVKVGYEAVDELPKEAHESPMLSLDKTKDVGRLKKFSGGAGSAALLEAGRPYCGTDLQGWTASQGSHPGKRGDWRSDHQGRPGI